jgi:hypothetical protein
MKIEEVSDLQENGKYRCKECLKEYTRQGISTHYWLNHGRGDKHLEKLRGYLQELHESQKGKPAWNSGLTAEADERIAKTRDSLHKRIESGDFMKSRRGVPLKDTTREKISEGRARFLNEQGNGGFRDVKWYKTIDSFGNECSLRGTWEVKVSEWLNEQGIKWSRKYYIKYLDNEIKRTYAPDFYIPNENTIIEVKGYYSEKDRRKMELVREQNPNLIVKILMQKEIENLNQLCYNKL